MNMSAPCVYPKPPGAWYELKVDDNPFPQQVLALDQIRAGLNGNAYFIETILNPWNVAEKLSSKEDLRRLQRESPRKLLDALDVITQSEIHHAKRALAAGASGILLSVANANAQEMPLEEKGTMQAGAAALKMEGIVLASISCPAKFVSGARINKCSQAATSLHAYHQLAFKAAVSALSE
jgi:hypothetical protein